MKALINLGILLLLVSCSKSEQLKETSFTILATDITSGNLSETAQVKLYEYYTPSRPFASINRNLIESFQIDYGSELSYSFNAKRGNGYEYVIEFENQEWFMSNYFQEGELIEGTTKCTLDKKEEQFCELKIIPSARVEISADNPLPDASEDDSIYVSILNDGVGMKYSCSGRGGCPWGGGELPHGLYEFRYEVYRNGVQDEEIYYPIYIRHRQDTNIVIEF